MKNRGDNFEEIYLERWKVSKKSPLYRMKESFKNEKYKKWWRKRKLETVKNVSRLLSINENHLFLDVGCGTGWLSAGIEEKFRCKTFGFDKERELISFSLFRAKNSGIKTKFLIASCENIPFRDGGFDRIIALDVIEHVKNPIRCLTEIKRVLKPGGKALVTFPNKLALYSPGHSNLKTQIKKFYIERVKGKSMNFAEHGILGYEHLFTYPCLLRILKTLKMKYTILPVMEEYKKRYMKKILKIRLFRWVFLLFKPEFLVIIEK